MDDDGIGDGLPRFFGSCLLCVLGHFDSAENRLVWHQSFSIKVTRARITLDKSILPTKTARRGQITALVEVELACGVELG